MNAYICSAHCMLALLESCLPMVGRWWREKDAASLSLGPWSSSLTQPAADRAPSWLSASETHTPAHSKRRNHSNTHFCCRFGVHHCYWQCNPLSNGCRTVSSSYSLQVVISCSICYRSIICIFKVPCRSKQACYMMWQVPHTPTRTNTQRVAVTRINSREICKSWKWHWMSGVMGRNLCTKCDSYFCTYNIMKYWIAHKLAWNIQ